MSTELSASVDTADLIAARSAAAAEYETQASVVAKLRGEGAACDASALEAELAKLKVHRQALDAAKKACDAATGGAGENAFNRAGCEMLLKRRFFVTPAFEIYGGVAGLYDYGPPGTCFCHLVARSRPFRPSSLPWMRYSHSKPSPHCGLPVMSLL